MAGFAAFMQFGLSFDYASSKWEGYHEAKNTLLERQQEQRQSQQHECQGGSEDNPSDGGNPGDTPLPSPPTSSSSVSSNCSISKGDVVVVGGGRDSEAGMGVGRYVSSDRFRELELIVTAEAAAEAPEAASAYREKHGGCLLYTSPSPRDS